MKPILYIALAGSLALGACSSTYKTAQTPDDVYYSPRQQQRTYASTNGSNGNSKQDENANYTQAADEEGTYVTYQDEDQGDYQRRLNRFGSSGNSYSGGYWDGYNAASSSLYMNNYYGMSPYSGFGMMYSPYSSFYGPSLSFGLGFGYGGGYCSPWSTGFYGGGWGYPYIGSYYPYYGGGFYGGGYYGGGYYGHGGYGGGYYSRPSNSYGPVRGSNERISRPTYTNSGGNGGGGYTRPSRSGTLQPSTGGYNGGTPSSDRPRRIFQQSNSERPVTRPSGNYQNSGGNNSGYSRPQRVEYSRPASTPSYTPPSSGSGRVSGGSSSGSGGYSRPSRGGR
ncbi:hypothetical protein CLV51_103466 [Chitinophaga niastensis]|uniref:Vitellogenin II n=1 Tax=Chitinophaga niastensis TaxID=536980 RepID=A0A2P8HJU1_CHINA|nr:hypothetical protein [Chitinophaga niastensis]PSL46487.1 hypothetical protein CLV51_103466 [Chitinophaga niastensis]